MDVIHHISSASKNKIFPFEQNYRDRSFWRNSRNLSPDEPIHHDVPDNQDLDVRKSVHYFLKRGLPPHLVQLPSPLSFSHNDFLKNSTVFSSPISISTMG